MIINKCFAKVAKMWENPQQQNFNNSLNKKTQPLFFSYLFISKTKRKNVRNQKYASLLFAHNALIFRLTFSATKKKKQKLCKI